jgi:hypothetical protein
MPPGEGSAQWGMTVPLPPTHHAIVTSFQIISGLFRRLEMFKEGLKTHLSRLAYLSHYTLILSFITWLDICFVF